MSFIASWLNDAFQAKAADKIVEDTLYWLKQRNRILDQYIPMQTYNTRKFMLYVMQERLTLASVIAFGAEVPITRMGSFNRITADAFKLGLTYEYDEDKQWEMKEAMEIAQAKGIGVQGMMVGNQMVPGTNQDLANYLYGSVQTMVRSVSETLDMLTWKALQTGEINYDDPRTQSKLTLNYKAPGATYNHFPNALTGNDRWDQLTTADGIQELFNAVDTYIDTNGFAPEVVVMSRKLRNLLMQQESTKKAGSMITTFPVGTVSPDLLNDILSRRDLPMVVTFDEQYEMEPSVGAASQQLRFLNDNRYVFMMKKMGERAMGPTLEGDGATGVHVVVREVSKVPPRDAIHGLATGVPMFPNPKLFYSRQVKD